MDRLYVSCSFVHPDLNSAPLFIGMQEGLFSQSLGTLLNQGSTVLAKLLKVYNCSSLEFIVCLVQDKSLLLSFRFFIL